MPGLLGLKKDHPCDSSLPTELCWIAVIRLAVGLPGLEAFDDLGVRADVHATWRCSVFQSPGLPSGSRVRSRPCNASAPCITIASWWIHASSMIGTAHACAPSRDTSPEITARHHDSTSARDAGFMTRGGSIPEGLAALQETSSRGSSFGSCACTRETRIVTGASHEPAGTDGFLLGGRFAAHGRGPTNVRHYGGVYSVAAPIWLAVAGASKPRLRARWIIERTPDRV